MKCKFNVEVENSTVAIIVATILAMAFCSYCAPVAHAQSVTRNGHTFTVSSSVDKKQEVETNEWFEAKGRNGDSVSYQIFLSKNGHAYVWRRSEKTGKDYKQYLPEEISKTLCKEYNVTYVPSKKKTQNAQ